MSTKLINAISNYIHLSSADSVLIQRLFQCITISKGDCWLKEGEVCRHLAFIEQGLLRFYINEEGREVTHYFADAGEFTCNYESLLNRSASRKNIQAIESTVLWVISQQNLEVFYKETGQGEKFGRLLMQAELLNTIARFLEHYTDSPKQRYQNFITQYAVLLDRIPQYYIASYVGVQSQSLSRIRKKMTPGRNLLTKVHE